MVTTNIISLCILVPSFVVFTAWGVGENNDFLTFLGLMFGIFVILFSFFLFDDVRTRDQNKHQAIYKQLNKDGIHVTWSQIHSDGGKDFIVSDVELPLGKCVWYFNVGQFGKKWHLFLPNATVGGGDYILNAKQVSLLKNICK